MEQILHGNKFTGGTFSGFLDKIDIMIFQSSSTKPNIEFDFDLQVYEQTMGNHILSLYSYHSHDFPHARHGANHELVTFVHAMQVTKAIE